MQEIDDHILMRRCATGDRQAYRELMGRHLAPSLRFAERMLGNRQDAEDVVQDVFFKVWKQAPNWQPTAKFSTWLYRVVHNACIDHVRKVLPFAAADLDYIEDGSPLPSHLLEEAQEAAGVKAAVDALPERQRAAVLLSYYEELDNNEAAKVMSLSLGAFQQLLFRARAALRSHLQLEQKEIGHG